MKKEFYYKTSCHSFLRAFLQILKTCHSFILYLYIYGEFKKVHLLYSSPMLEGKYRIEKIEITKLYIYKKIYPKYNVFIPTIIHIINLGEIIIYVLRV